MRLWTHIHQKTPYFLDGHLFSECILCIVSVGDRKKLFRQVLVKEQHPFFILDDILSLHVRGIHLHAWALEAGVGTKFPHLQVDHEPAGCVLIRQNPGVHVEDSLPLHYSLHKGVAREVVEPDRHGTSFFLHAWSDDKLSVLICNLPIWVFCPSLRSVFSIDVVYQLIEGDLIPTPLLQCASATFFLLSNTHFLQSRGALHSRVRPRFRWSVSRPLLCNNDENCSPSLRRATHSISFPLR